MFKKSTIIHLLTIKKFNQCNFSNVPFSFANIGNYSLPEPLLQNQYLHDPVLSRFLRRRLPSTDMQLIEEDLTRFGGIVGDELYHLGRQCEVEKPLLKHFDAFGRRVDVLVTGEAWRGQKIVSAKEGMVATAYAAEIGQPTRFVSRLYQMAKIYLYSPSSGMYGCPLAMTDGAAKVLETELFNENNENSSTFATAFKHLTTRNPTQFWTSGQWMTEKRGGSDVAGGTETLAVANTNGCYSLHGYKWFSSATDSDMALTLARVTSRRDGIDKVAGSQGLSLFYLETRLLDNSLNGLQLVRLKDKLGTRQLPTAELLLDGCRALRVGPVGRGVSRISDMLTVTRLHNAAASASGMRRLVNLARDYASKRQVFGRFLIDWPLHVRLLTSLELNARGATLYFLEVARLFALQEADMASERDKHLLRLATPLVKLYIAKLSVSLGSEAIESFGGLGYLEDSGIPSILRDLQVTPIWEGTTNVLSLDVLRCVRKSTGYVLLALKDDIVERAISAVSSCPELAESAELVIHSITELLLVIEKLSDEESTICARELAFSLARCHIGALLLTEAAADASETELAAAQRWCTRSNLAPLLGVIQRDELSLKNINMDRTLLLESQMQK